MRKIRFLILTAVFAFVGLSIVSCPGASPSGTAKVSEAAAALGAGIPLNTPFDTAALHSDIAITLANVSTVDSWNTPADAITWLKWKASADAETQDMTADTIGGVTVTATPTGEGKDCISVNIKSTAGAQKEFDGILTEIVIPADKLTSNAELAVKLGIGDNNNGVPLKFVNSGTRVAGTPVVVFADGSTGVQGGMALYSIASSFNAAFITAVNENTATPAQWLDVTSWFPGFAGKNIKAYAKRIATADKAATEIDPFPEYANKSVEVVFKSDATTAPAAGFIKSNLVISNPSEGMKYLPDGTGTVTIADAVKTYVRQPAGQVSATVAITKSDDATKKTIKGATRTALDAELTITIDGDCVEFDIKKDNEDVAASLAQLIALPLGVKASLKDDISAGDTSFAIALTGKPSDITEANVEAAQNRWADTENKARALLTAAIDGYLPGANPWEPGTENYEHYLPLLSGTYEADHVVDFFKGLLHVSNPEGDNQLKWAITETPYAVISDVDEDSPKAIRGIVGQQLPGDDNARMVSITLNRGHFKAIEGGTDLISWFGTEGQDFPTSAAGENKIKAVTIANTTDTAVNINVRISGIPTAEFAKKVMKITIPADKYTVRKGDDYENATSALVVDTNDFAYWEAKAAYATVSNATINGKINTAIVNQAVTLTLTNANFVTFTNDNKTVTSWFTNLPQGLSATAAVQDPGTSVVVTISGTPTAASNAPLEITIPKEMMTDLAQEPAELTSDITVDANANCKFAISPAATVSEATISGTVGNALAANQTVTITLHGAKFVAFTDQNKDVSTWFALPEGLSATAAVQAAGTSVAVTISGTPTEASDQPLAIEIPANMMTDLNGGQLEADFIIVDPNDNCRFNITDGNDPQPGPNTGD